MTITEQTTALEAYQGCARCPDDLESFWRRCLAPTAKMAECHTHPVPFQNSAAVYEDLFIPSAGGGTIHARHIRPVGEGPFPIILMFHDLGRKIRGWHHMTRFTALGYAVVALENRLDASDQFQELPPLKLEQSFKDAFTVATAARALPYTDAAHLATWGRASAAHWPS